MVVGDKYCLLNVPSPIRLQVVHVMLSAVETKSIEISLYREHV